MSEASLLIWDLDGTLVDSTADLAAAANAVRVGLGLLPLDEAAVAACVGDGLAKLLERLLPGADAATLEQAKTLFDAAYLPACAQRTRAFPGVEIALEQLAEAGFVQAVASNKPDRYTGIILKELGLLRWIRVWRGGDGPRKPATGQLTSLMSELGYTPAQTWMIGDHHTDLHAGRAAGCRTLHVTWGIGHAAGVEADAVAETPEELVKILVGAKNIK
jgi:phosphoglycolate phosphatase